MGDILADRMNNLGLSVVVSSRYICGINDRTRGSSCQCYELLENIAFGPTTANLLGWCKFCPFWTWRQFLSKVWKTVITSIHATESVVDGCLQI